MNCLHHPDRRAISICQKFGQGYCEECCRCTDPRGYCKFRSQCIGWQVCGKAKKISPQSPPRVQKRNPNF